MKSREYTFESDGKNSYSYLKSNLEMDFFFYLSSKWIGFRKVSDEEGRREWKIKTWLGSTRL